MCFSCRSTAEDARGQVPNSMTRKLGNLSGKNNSRDWWRAFKDGPETRFGYRVYVSASNLERKQVLLRLR